MRCFDLSLPLDHEWMPDEVFPIATHFLLGPRYDENKGITVGSNTGTCITLPAQFVDFRKTRRLHEIQPAELFLRPAAILHIPKKEGEEITDQEIEKTIELVRPEPGDAIMIKSGWGDLGIHAQPGPKYVLRSPHLSVSAAKALVTRMQATQSNLLLTDLALLGLPKAHLLPEWCSINPLPRPWPSPEARVYLRLYTAEKAAKDFAVELELAKAGIMTVNRLIGCKEFVGQRSRIIVAPLRVVRGVASTCRVIAIQE
jgi:kynurenine formamidase